MMKAQIPFIYEKELFSFKTENFNLEPILCCYFLVNQVLKILMCLNSTINIILENHNSK